MLKLTSALTRYPIRTLVAILLLYSLLILPTARRHGISWDEQTDIAIARSYLTDKMGLAISSKFSNVVQTTSDGVEQCVIWINEHGHEGDRVVLYMNPWHIVQATRNPKYGSGLAAQIELSH